MNTGKRLVQMTVASCFAASCMGFAVAGEHAVNITPSLEKVEVMHQGRAVLIERVQDQSHLISSPYNKTSRPCPPFCIQPMTIAPGVETVGELELLGYLKQVASGDRSILVVDSRTRDWA